MTSLSYSMVIQLKPEMKLVVFQKYLNVCSGHVGHWCKSRYTPICLILVWTLLNGIVCLLCSIHIRVRFIRHHWFPLWTLFCQRILFLYLESTYLQCTLKLRFDINIRKEISDGKEEQGVIVVWVSKADDSLNPLNDSTSKLFYVMTSENVVEHPVLKQTAHLVWYQKPLQRK